MLQKPKRSISLGAALCALLFLTATVAAWAQTTTTERAKGNATVSTSQLNGEVVQVEGNDLLVKLSTGELRTFRVPETRRFTIDGKELSVHDLKPGTTLIATVKTTTTPVTVRTKSALSGRVWYVAAPTVILTLPDGQNKQYLVKRDSDVKFMVDGREATVFELRKGMKVSAEKIVEEPDVEIVTDTAVVGHAPAPAPAPEPSRPEAKPLTAAQPAAPEPATPAVPEPSAPEAKGTNPVVWVVGLVVVLFLVAILMRKRKKQ